MSVVIEHLGKRLRNRRRELGLSQRELAKRCAIPQPHISRIEQGEVDLRASTLIELARALESDFLLVPNRAVTATKVVIRQLTRPVEDEPEELHWRIALELEEEQELADDPPRRQHDTLPSETANEA